MMPPAPFRAMICMTTISGLAVDSDWVDSDRHPTAGSSEFHNAVAVQENVEGAWRKVVVTAVFEDDVNVHVPCYVQG
jgi:hypothetical protein